MSHGGRPVDLSAGDLGDVLAVVEDAAEFVVPERAWQKVDLDAALIGAVVGPLGVAAGLIILSLVKPLGQHAQDPSVALIGIKDARMLQAKGALFFPQAGPTVGHVYVRHPLRRSDYLPFADYHRHLLHERSIEFARYLLTLGAQDIEIGWREVKGKSGKGEGGAETPSAADVSLSMGMGRDNNGDLAIRITGAGRSRPEPSDLIWPDFDPMFKLARDTGTAKAETFHFGIQAKQSSVVNASTAASLNKTLGLHPGGEYKRWESLTFTVDVRFRAARRSQSRSGTRAMTSKQRVSADG